MTCRRDDTLAHRRPARRAATAVDRRRSRRSAGHLVADDRAVPAARGRALRASFVALPDRPEHPLQPLRLERARAARPTSSGSTTSAGRSPTNCSATPCSTTSILIVLSLLLQIPFALGLALLLNVKLPGRAMLRTLFFAPYVLSEVVTGVVWRQILRPDGLLDHGLDARRRRGARSTSGSPTRTSCSTACSSSSRGSTSASTWCSCSPGCSRSRRSSTRRRRSTAPSSWQRFRYVTLPLLGPTIRVSVFLSIIGALQLFDLVWVTTKGGPDRRLVDDGDVPVRPVPQEPVRLRQRGVDRDLRPVARRRARLPAGRAAPRPPRDWSRWLSFHSTRWRSIARTARRKWVGRGPSTSSRSSCWRDHHPAHVLGARRLPHQPAARRRTRSACPTRGSARTTPRSSSRATFWRQVCNSTVIALADGARSCCPRRRWPRSSSPATRSRAASSSTACSRSGCCSPSPSRSCRCSSCCARSAC